jgi:hypothetical protein
MSDRKPITSLSTYRLVEAFRAEIDKLAMAQRPTGGPEWHMYDDHAVHLATSKVRDPPKDLDG